ncbi:ADP-heptose:LPS heptosyltransferase RfaF, partial [Brachyspira hampsonii 30599]
KDVDNVLTIDDSGIMSMAISTFKLVLQLLEKSNRCFYRFRSLFQIL